MKVIDLFSGCGGMSLGFQNSGYNLIAAFDNWKPAIDVYRDNFSHPVIECDLGSEEAREKIKEFDADMIVGGPPCQDFSIAGPRDDNGKRANLTITFIDIIGEIKPEWMVMENVYNIERSRVLPEVLRKLNSFGYGVSYRVLDASFLGVPQARKRFFLVGHLNSNDNFLEEDLLSNHTLVPLTVREYMGDKLAFDYYYAHPRSYNRRAIFSVDEPSSTIRGVNRPMPKTYKKHPGDKTNVFPNLKSLTTKQRSLLQTFPEEFILNGTKTSLEQAIGNAVPVKMAEHVAFAIKKYVDRKKIDNKLAG